MAEKLREDLPVARNVQEGYVAIMQTIGVRPCLLMVEGQSGDRFDVTAYEEGAARLADLIDPTCHMVDTDHEYEDSIRCDVCQMTFNRPWEPFKFCPNCGARVVSDDE